MISGIFFIYNTKNKGKSLGFKYPNLMSGIKEKDQTYYDNNNFTLQKNQSTSNNHKENFDNTHNIKTHQ